MKYFGTDGIRGKANHHPITPEFCIKLGRAIVKVFLNNNKFLIGMDTRISGPMLHHAIAAGINSQGGNIIPVGILPTPAIGFLTSETKSDAGIMITASHNPAEDNGIKVIAADGSKISKEFEKKIENLLDQESFSTIPGSVNSLVEAKRIYIDFLKDAVQNSSLKGMKIVLDCSNGAASKVAPIVFQELEAEVISINDKPDGQNINKNCGAANPEQLRQKVIETNSNLGIAFDGDADRMVAVDEKGMVADGDSLIVLFAKSLKDNHSLNNNKIVATKMSNISLELELKKIGLEVVRSDVGDRNVSEVMNKEDISFGGENSGHLIFRDNSMSGDGILSGLMLATITKGKNLSQNLIKLSPSLMVNINVTKKPDLEKLLPVQQSIHEAKSLLRDTGRVFVRYSGTEDICRILVEGQDKEMIKSLSDNIIKSFEEVGICKQ
jgi:phosphoglucosamine mutase